VDFLLFALYVGPDQMMPVASILATIMGFVMIFWNKVLGIFRRIFGGAKPAADDSASLDSKENEPPK
jgi:hypothetical protein